jgi:hypothetical protein
MVIYVSNTLNELNMDINEVRKYEIHSLIIIFEII